MKRCFVMFVFFVVTLFLADLTDDTNDVLIDDKMVESELAIENQLTNEIVSDKVLEN